MMTGFARIALLFLLAAGVVQAHPHIFIESSARFVVDEGGHLTAIEIEHLYDPLFTLFVLNDLGVDPNEPLPKAVASPHISRRSGASGRLIGKV